MAIRRSPDKAANPAASTLAYITVDFDPKYETLRYNPFEIQQRWLKSWATSSLSEADHHYFQVSSKPGAGVLRFLVFQDFFTRANRYFRSVSPDTDKPVTYPITNHELVELCNCFAVLTGGVEPLEAVFENSTSQTMLDESANELLNSAEINLAQADVDQLRLAFLRNKPISETCDARNLDLDGSSRFLQRVWRLARTHLDDFPNLRSGPMLSIDTEVQTMTDRLMNQCLNATNRFSASSYLAQLATFNNELHRYTFNPVGAHDESVTAAINMLVLLLSPACPVISAELFVARKDML